MRNFIATGAAVLAAITIPTAVIADECSKGDSEIGGNWYCQAVTTVQYTNLGTSGTYDKVTNMDSTTGSCSSSSYSYSGNIAPLNEEVSLHFRGPLELKQFAAYVPSSSSSSKAKRDPPKARLTPHARRHGHEHFHAHNKEIREIQDAAVKEKRADIWVTATIDGKVVSWINEWDGGAEATTTATAYTASTVAAQVTSVAAKNNLVKVKASSSSTTSSSAAASSSSTSDTVSSTGAWEQTAYYNAASGSSSGLTFLNNYGGSGSGTFDYVFGNSLSYANAAGTGGASSSTVLDNVMIESNKEVIIMTDTSCDDESGCGYVRPGTVAYHGFGGGEKVFLFEFSMPDDGTSGTNMNMPAIWMLNAQIPRTLQYGSADCSCWTSGCGEFDIIEVLDSGNTRCKSTFHSGQSAGDSDYFTRPVNSTIKLAVVMTGSTATIKVLSDSFSIPSVLSAQKVARLSSNSWSDVANNVVSNFALSS